jgi:thiol-disulfide isomerase/thioredoxin
MLPVTTTAYGCLCFALQNTVGCALPTVTAATILWCSLCSTGHVAEQAKEVDAPTYSLHFPNGDFLVGCLLDSQDADALTWQSAAFRAPLRFSVSAVQSIQFQRAINARVSGSYCFELAGGDALYGSLAALDEREAVIETSGLGKLHLDRAIVHRLFRASARDLIFAGPGGLEGWEVAGPAKTWREEGGHLRTDQPDATLRRKVSLQPLMRYEIELSWSALPNFELSVGVDKDRPGIRPAFRLETWGDELVIVRESERAADFCALQKLSPGAGQVHFQALFDQKQGRLIVLSATGEKLADLTVPEDKGSPTSAAARGKPILFKLPLIALGPAGGVQLVNRRGDLKLQRLTISRWSGQVTDPAEPGKAWLHLTDGTSRSAEVRSYDAQAQQFVLREADADLRLEASQLEQMVFSPPSAAAPRSVRLLLTTGERISGDLLRMEHNTISLLCPGIREPLTFSLNQLHSLFVVQHKASSSNGSTPTNSSPEGRLELDGVSLHGRLGSAQVGESACLTFQPRHAHVASPLVADISGRLVYRDPPPPKPATPPPQNPQQPAVRVLNGVRTLLGARYTPAARPAAPGDCLLHLRTGDTLICRVQNIDEQGVWLKSTQTTADFVPHAKIKALELRQDIPSAKIEKTKADRLLTLPRMQRDNPPEHLIRSLEGDYVRGRLLAMDDKQLQIELRLENRTVERAQVARIIWLHPDEIVTAANPDAAVANSPPRNLPAGVCVQAVPRDGRRLTFFAQQIEGSTLIGHSDVLGNCRVSLDQIDQLLIGPMIDQSAASLAFHQWKLRPAAEPLPTPEEADPGSSEGLESVLVGKPAPPIDLDLLGGKKFRLDEYKNKVVVLDFWASWCGPCLQTMPLVDKVAREFAEQGVSLVAINLEESPERIQTALDRLKLETLVALDRDGRVAERYGATAIPQTVIIDRDGKVARLFVGGSPRFDVQLRQALQSVLGRPEGKTN